MASRKPIDGAVSELTAAAREAVIIQIERMALRYMGEDEDEDEEEVDPHLDPRRRARINNGPLADPAKSKLGHAIVKMYINSLNRSEWRVETSVYHGSKHCCTFTDTGATCDIALLNALDFFVTEIQKRVVMDQRSLLASAVDMVRSEKHDLIKTADRSMMS